MTFFSSSFLLTLCIRSIPSTTNCYWQCIWIKKQNKKFPIIQCWLSQAASVAGEHLLFAPVECWVQLYVPLHFIPLSGVHIFVPSTQLSLVWRDSWDCVCIGRWLCFKLLKIAMLRVITKTENYRWLCFKLPKIAMLGTIRYDNKNWNWQVTLF